MQQKNPHVICGIVDIRQGHILSRPIRKPAKRLRIGKEEVSSEDKRRRLRRLVPSRSLPTCLRRPHLFSRKRKDGGTGRWKPVDLPLGELSPQAAERVFAVTVYPLRLRFAQTPLPKGEARNAGKRKFLAHICQSASPGTSHPQISNTPIITIPTTTSAIMA